MASREAASCCNLRNLSCTPLYCRLVDEIVWVKMTVNRRLAKSHGFYLQHAKEASSRRCTS